MRLNTCSISSRLSLSLSISSTPFRSISYITYSRRKFSRTPLKSYPARPLKDNTILITGASRGIGAEIAKRFASEGGKCVLVGRNKTLLGGVRDSLGSLVEEEEGGRGEKEGGEEGREGTEERHRIVVGDVGDMEFWGRMRGEKNIDILINAAGITHYSPLFVTSPSLLEEVVHTNLIGTMMACRTVGKNMMVRKEGCIINVASLLGLKGGKGSAAYAASKAGVISKPTSKILTTIADMNICLTRALAAELGEKNIRVNVLIPGYIETDMTDAMTPAARSEALNAIPLKRFGQASEIADAAMFLATNKYANNCVLNLDGGLSAI